MRVVRLRVRAVGTPSVLIVVDAATVGALLVWPGMSVGALIAFHVVAYAAFVALVVRLRGPAGDSLSSTVVWTAGAALLIVAVARPPAQSHDLWSYAFYGRIRGVYHRSPYRLAPAAFPHDGWLAKVDPAWRHARSVYGGLFTMLSAGFVRLAGASLLRARLLFQGAEAVAVAAAGMIVQRVSRSVAAVAIIVLNPLVILSIVNGGHNDALVGLGVLAAVLLARRGLAAAAGAALAAAALVKLSALVAGAALVLWMLHRFGRRAAISVALSLLAVTAVGTALVGGPASIGPLRGASSRISADTVWGPIDRALIVEDESEQMPPARADASADREVTRLAAIVLGGAVLLVALATRRADDLAIAVFAGLAVYLVLGTYVLPWYTGWAIPLLALRARSRWVPALLAYMALLQLAYIPDYAHGQFFAVRPAAVAVAQTDLRTIILPMLAAAIAGVAVVAAARTSRPVRVVAVQQ